MIHNFMTEHVTGERLAGIAQAQMGYAHNPSHERMLLRAKICYCKLDYIFKAFEIFRNRTRPVVLITHNSDYRVTKITWEQRPECIKKWFAQNVEVLHEDLVPLPIGMENRVTPGYSGDMDVVEKIRRSNIQKKYLCFLNINPRTNLDARLPVIEDFCREPWVHYEKYGIPFEQCMAITKACKFTLCPEGNGLDTHRVWESLYLGTYPIVKRSYHWRGFNDLPILVVDRWEQVTEDVLNRAYEKYESMQWDLSKLKMSYWKKRIRECTST